MRPNARGVLLLLSSLSLTQAAENRRDGLLDRLLGRAVEYIDRRQIEPRTITVRQTITVGAADAEAAGNSTVYVTVTGAPAVVNAAVAGGGAQLSFLTTTVFGSGAAPTVTITALASTITQTVCPGQAQGAAAGADISAGGASVAASLLPSVAAGAVAAPALPAAVPGAAGVPSGGVGVVIIPVPTQLRTLTGALGGAGATAAAPAAAPPPSAAPVAQNPAAGTLAPLPGSVAGASSLQALQPLPGSVAGGSSLQQLPGLSTSAAVAATGLQPLPGVATSAAATVATAVTSLAALAPVGGSPSLAPIAIPSATALDSTLNLGAIAPTPVAAPPDAFGGQAGAIPISDAGLPAAAQAAVTAAPSPGVANAGAEVVNIDVSGLTLNSQLNLGNLVQATAVSATK